jgi:LuxR family maltose regulon positive regulatory protein
MQGGFMTGSSVGKLAVAQSAPKIQAPILRDGLVARTRLLRHLAATPDDVPLVLLAAPAGYGKTTVLSQWSATDARDFTWVTVEEADKDPVRLAGRIARALHRIEPLDPAVFRALADGDGSRHLVALPHLLASLRSWARPGVLVLDDAHELQTVGAVNFVRALAAGLPPGFRIAAGSRLVLAFGRLRSEGRYVEFGPDHLKFTEDEARVVLLAAGVDCSDHALRALVRRTEGWPAGVYLAALATRAASDAAETAGGIAGDDPFIVDYVRDELLARESSATVRFLLRTAALGHMCGALCDHVLGGSGSASRLADAARRNLFVVPLDRHGEWYRYHRLIAEMLLSELRRREPGEELRVHRRAAAWYVERGLPEEAIAHAVAGQDTMTAATLVNRHAGKFCAEGRLRTVCGWLDALDSAGLADYPPLAITAAWIFALSGDPLRAQQCLHVAERGSFEGPLPDGSISLTSAIAVLRAVMGGLGVDRMLLDATAAVDLEQPGSPWHPIAMGMLGVAHALAGAPGLAVKELSLAARAGRAAQPPAAAAALAEMSLLAAERDDWPRAERKAGQALEVIATGHLQQHLFSIVSYTAAARVAAHQRDRQAARRHVGTALRLYTAPSPAAFPWLSAQVALTLGQIFLDLGDFVAARHWAEEARGHLTRLLTEGTLRDQLRRLSADLARQGGHVRVPSPMALSPAEMRVLQLLPTHLSLGEIGDELYTSRNTVKTHVAAVYRKLQCSTRTQAVQRGHDLGLLAS